jgi:hypothetical protein
MITELLQKLNIDDFVPEDDVKKVLRKGNKN